MNRPEIVILDSWTVNPGDLDFSALEALGHLTCYDRTPEEQVVARAAEAQIVLSNKTPLMAPTLAQLPKLKFISVLATGVNTVDLPAAAGQGIIVSNVPAYSTMSVAQTTFAHILNLSQRVQDHSTDVRAGGWATNPDFSYTLTPLTELDGLTLGLIGWGQIAAAVAKIALAFNMNVLAYSPSLADGRKQITLPNVQFRPLEALVVESDIISLHCPLTNSNVEMVNDAFLARMKPTAWLINTARGKLVNESSVAAALAEKRLAAYATDVLSQEPPTDGSPLLNAPNSFFTPHNAWATQAARKRLLAVSAENVRAFLAGKPQNVVS